MNITEQDIVSLDRIFKSKKIDLNKSETVEVGNTLIGLIITLFLADCEKSS